MDKITIGGAAQAPQSEQPSGSFVEKEGLQRTTVSTEPQTDPNAPPPPDPNRPAWLPEKFKSPEDLAKAYSELETKLGQPKPQEQPKAPTTEQMQAKVKEAGLDFNALSKEYVEKGGQLSPETLKALADKGIPKETVDSYIEGQKALAEQRNARLADSVGGKEAVESIFEWARSNLTPEQITAADKALAGSEEAAQLVLQGLKAQYEAAVGSPPKAPVRGVSAPVAGVAPFESSQQVSDAMNDPRYKSDPGFRAKVYQRLAVSPTFGTHRY